MSFYRIAGPNTKKRPPRRKTPAWDDSVNDLTVYKATPEEVLLRKEAHKSKNHISVKLQQMRKETNKKKLSGAQAQQLAIMKEVLYDQQQLQDVLAKSDTMMAVVKDLFGDDPKRYTGFPNVTTAPHADRSDNLVASLPVVQTRTEKLSESVMDQSALNDLENTDSDDEEDDIDQPKPISYESKLNLQHFQEYLQEEEKKFVLHDPPSMVNQLNRNQSNGPQQTDTQLRHDPAYRMQLLASLLEQGNSLNLQDPRLINVLMAGVAANAIGQEPKTPPREQQNGVPLPSERTPPSAINDTKKIKKTKRRTIPNSPKSDSVNTTANMNTMRQALQELESEIATYEHQTGRRQQNEAHQTETFSGYTTALVTAVSRLTKYLKEADLRIRTEVTLREQLTQDVYQLRTIIDALATDVIVTQEEYGKLYSEHQRYKDSTLDQLASLTKQMQEIQLLVPRKQCGSTSCDPSEQQHHQISQNQHDQQQQCFQESINTSKKSNESRTSTPLLNQQERQTSLVDLAQLTSEPGQSVDPPRLTQAPPVINTVNVPRPIPLVQSNVSVPLTSMSSIDPKTVGPFTAGLGSVAGTASHPIQINDLDKLVKMGDQTEQQLNRLQEIAVEEALNNPAMQTLMQNQIQELNRQQEEARQRLRDLLDNQKIQQQILQQELGPDVLIQGDISPTEAQNSGRSQKVTEQSTVSPPISPIPQRSERDTKNGQTRGVVVALPMVDLDIST